MSRQRPLSPFMLGQDYKLQLTSALSFLHRASGVALVLALLLISCWVAALAAGIDSYQNLHRFIISWPVLCVLVMGSWAAFYHLCNGVRHLLWDLGIGFSKPVVARSAQIVLFAASLLTLVVWLVVLV